MGGQAIVAARQVAVKRNEGYSVGRLSLAVINAGLAHCKNRSGLNWFLVSLLLGSIVTFLLVAFYPKGPH